MTPEEDKPELLMWAFIDYACPFSYIANKCLDKICEEYYVLTNWCFYEIHPDAAMTGRTVEEMGFEKSEWEPRNKKLLEYARSEGVAIEPETFITNTQRAMLLAEGAKMEGREKFYRLHNNFFDAYHIQKENIGRPNLLIRLASEIGMDTKKIEAAWESDRFQARLAKNIDRASKWGITDTPAFVIGKKILQGVVTTDMLREAADMARSEVQDFI